MGRTSFVFGLGVLLISAVGLNCRADELVLIPEGNYVPSYSPAASTTLTKTSKLVQMKPFEMDLYPVTKRQFALFLKTHPAWSRSRAKGIFVDSSYLANWDELGEASPVTGVSWFAARAYCHARGEELPTTDQWEYVASDRGKGQIEAQKAEDIRYSHPETKILPAVTHSVKNGYGVYGLYDGVWEWTLDFSADATDETERNSSCGNGSAGSPNPQDSWSFMRYSLRNSLKAKYTTKNLGFRCVKEI